MLSVTVIRAQFARERDIWVIAQKTKEFRRFSHSPIRTTGDVVTTVIELSSYVQVATILRKYSSTPYCSFADLCSSCVCKAQWCYVCRVEWKKCDCAQWDEQRLLERAERDVARQPVAQVPQAVVGGNQAQQVIARAQRLRRNQECEHQHFVRVGGVNECDECGRECTCYIHRCSNCRLDLCHVCLRRR